MLYHFDCYRIDGADMLMVNELHEAIERDDGIVVVEWAERIAETLPPPAAKITFEPREENTRIITIEI